MSRGERSGPPLEALLQAEGSRDAIRLASELLEVRLDKAGLRPGLENEAAGVKIETLELKAAALLGPRG